MCYGDYHKTNRIAMYNTWRCRRDKIMIEMGRLSLGRIGQSDDQRYRPSTSASNGSSRPSMASHSAGSQHGTMIILSFFSACSRLLIFVIEHNFSLDNIEPCYKSWL
jgi:hypothetical protein